MPDRRVKTLHDWGESKNRDDIKFQIRVALKWNAHMLTYIFRIWMHCVNCKFIHMCAYASSTALAL